MSQRFEGKNVEDALGQAAEAFGVERYRLTYHVVMEKRGFLGGVKRVVIEAEINEGATQPPPAAPAPPPVLTEFRAVPVSAPAPRAPRGRERERERPSIGPRTERGQRSDRGGGRRERGGRGGKRGARPAEDVREPMEPFDATDVPEQGPESENARTVRQWCEDVLRHGRFDILIRTKEDDQQIELKLYGRDARLFLDRNGELLDALQVLANKALVGRKIEKDIELDCSEFKERRVEEIGAQAREIAERVRRDGREQLLPAMSPIERRIVHLALQDDAEVMTESQGDGFFKRVAIKRRPPASPPDSQTSSEP